MRTIPALIMTMAMGCEHTAVTVQPCELKASLSDWKVVAAPGVKYEPTECRGQITGYRVSAPDGSDWHLEREMAGYVGDTIKASVRVEPGQGERYIEVGGDRRFSTGDRVEIETTAIEQWNTYKIGGTGSFWIGDATFYFGP